MVIDNMSNIAILAMKELQEKMLGEAERTGFTSDEKVMDLVKEIREESSVTIDAIEEGRRIATDTKVKGYRNIEDLKIALEDDSELNED